MYAYVCVLTVVQFQDLINSCVRFSETEHIGLMNDNEIQILCINCRNLLPYGHFDACRTWEWERERERERVGEYGQLGNVILLFLFSISRSCCCSFFLGSIAMAAHPFCQGCWMDSIRRRWWPLLRMLHMALHAYDFCS